MQGYLSIWWSNKMKGKKSESILVVMDVEFAEDFAQHRGLNWSV